MKRVRDLHGKQSNCKSTSDLVANYRITFFITRNYYDTKTDQVLIFRSEQLQRLLKFRSRANRRLEKEEEEEQRDDL